MASRRACLAAGASLLACALSTGALALAGSPRSSAAPPSPGSSAAPPSPGSSAAPPSPGSSTALPSPSTPASPAPADAAGTALRGWLAHHLEDQQVAVAAALQSVDEKLAVAHARQGQRADLAYRVLRHRPARSPAAPPFALAAASPSPSAELAAVRRRAAVKWLLARDRDEVAMLVDERQHLAASRERLTAAALQLAAVPLPPRQLPWPAPGSIARAFGPFAHERSGVTLSRRGLDLDVAERSSAGALAAGTVAYAGPVRGLDQCVLIDHGTYWTLIGKLDTLEVAQGEAVTARQPLGRAARRRLYLELRLKLLPAGIPIDPAPFLAAP